MLLSGYQHALPLHSTNFDLQHVCLGRWPTNGYEYNIVRVHIIQSISRLWLFGSAARKHENSPLNHHLHISHLTYNDVLYCLFVIIHHLLYPTWWSSSEYNQKQKFFFKSFTPMWRGLPLNSVLFTARSKMLEIYSKLCYLISSKSKLESVYNFLITTEGYLAWSSIILIFISC